MRRILAGLGGRLAIACALIAVVSVVITGAVMYTSARNNIFQAEQNRLFDEFRDMRDKLTQPPPCLLEECAAMSAEALVAAASSNLRGPVLLVPADASGNEPTATGMIPVALQETVKNTGKLSWLRQRDGLRYSFFIGAPVTLTLYPDNGGVLASSLSSPWKIVVPPDEGGQSVQSYLYATYFMGDQQRQIDDLAESTAWLVALMAVVAALAGVALARWIAWPVRQLREAVESLDADQGSLDVSVKGVQELTGLVEAFNAASSRLQAAMAELKVKEAQSQRFVADVSHELRTPVTAMVAMADVLEYSSGEGEAVQEAAAVTARAARRLSALTEDLLEISRFDAAHNMVHPEEIDVTEHLRELLDSRDLVDSVNLTAGSDIRFSTDPRRLEVIVTNLLLNALKHGEAPVTLSVAADEHGLVLNVSDHGPGISTANAGHLFDRFYKSDSSRSRGGTGLGLSLVQENCWLLGGTVALTSTSNPTTFTVRLPPLG